MEWGFGRSSGALRALVEEEGWIGRRKDDLLEGKSGEEGEVGVGWTMRGVIGNGFFGLV